MPAWVSVAWAHITFARAAARRLSIDEHTHSWQAIKGDVGGCKHLNGHGIWLRMRFESNQ